MAAETMPDSRHPVPLDYAPPARPREWNRYALVSALLAASGVPVTVLAEKAGNPMLGLPAMLIVAGLAWMLGIGALSQPDQRGTWTAYVGLLVSTGELLLVCLV